MNGKWWVPVLLVLGLAACSSAPRKAPTGSAAIKGIKVDGRGQARVATGCPAGASLYAAAQEDPSTRGNYVAGGLYKPGVKDSTPDHLPNVDCIPEPLVSNEPHSAIGNKSPYDVLGKTYRVLDDAKGYDERGTASYYGAKFHGRLTSNKEVYDVNAFTAAHKTLPLPSFALVTNLDNGESVVVRINDRGPFHDGRLIDLSYAAAVKLGITAKGTGNVEVRGLTEADNPMLLARQQARGQGPAPALAQARPVPRPAASDSAIDKLVGQLPPKAAPTPAAATDTGSPLVARSVGDAAERWRYRVADSKKPGSADNFDAWMKSQGVRVATGKPAPVATAATAPASASQAVARQQVASVAPQAAVERPLPAARPATTPVTAVAMAEPEVADKPSMAEAALGNILLQVASFASRENANRALAQLASAGIVGASISDIASGGRTMWRLRVNARDHAAASELAGRIAGLGFGRPQIVSR